MLTNRPALLRRTARLFSRGGFTLVELLVVIGIIAILAGVALGPITRGITQAKESGVMQVTRQIGLAEFAYSNDNNQTYPYGDGSTDESIADLLLNGNYVTDPNIFYVTGTPGQPNKPSGLSSPFSMLTGTVSFDFMVSSSSGLTSGAADGTPLVEGIGGKITMKATGPIDNVLNTATTSFGTDGITVTYKSNSAKFAKASAGTITAFVDSSFNDPSGASYKLLAP
jgi:prepilin-type N-terminal cleavage/methylation domain-containing protein